MSTQAIEASGAVAQISPGASAVQARVEQLQELIARVQAGPESFASAFQGALSSSAGEPAATTASVADYSTSSRAGTGAEGAAGSLTSAQGAGGDSLTGVPYASLIEQSAEQNGIEPSLLAGLIKQESGFDASATSSAGAEGLTQLMPGTASSLGVSEPLDPAQSIAGGAGYLGGLLKQFDGNVDDALAAYNAGPGAVDQYGGVPPYAETESYVTDVLENAAGYRQGSTVAASATAGAIAT
jgi:soluble lytic murein transglycosylase-like protein